MGNLPSYVNMGGYCEELCNITDIKFHEIESIVNSVFVSIHNGEVDAVDGLVYIDTILTLLVNPQGLVQPEQGPKLVMAI